MRHLKAIVLGLLLCALHAAQAVAHPHIFVDAKANIVFDAVGRVIAIHNSWSFDEAYSAWSTQGLDTDNDGTITRQELQPLADDNMDGLAEYEYYTYAGEGADTLGFVHGRNATIDFKDGRTTLTFDVSLKEPYRIQRALEIAINDPEYYVAIEFAGASAVTLVNAPSGCSVAMEEGHPMSDELAAELAAIPADVTKIPPKLLNALRGVQGAILVNCPNGAPGTGEAPPAEPATALDAANALAETPAPDATTAMAQTRASGTDIPFGGPPPEPGLNLPRTGFFGWIAQVQKDFYRALTNALGRLASDWTAFWVLGSLSFLYGIFHAAGPGHGKIVISSYVLANEQQMRRGVWLSFLAAMMQSAVAVVFVLVLALALGLTSMALNDAANWIGILSYLMVALLGAWLIIRHVFGLGHRHGRAPVTQPPIERQTLARRAMGVVPTHALAAGGRPLTEFARQTPDAHGRIPGHPHYGHAHGEEDAHAHAHVVTPDQTGGGWREQLGVVLAVGLRPCSGALVVLAFALSQGVLVAGIAAVFLMGLGTAITTGTLAAIAVGAKGLARALAGADNPMTAKLLWWTELLGAVAIFAFGITLVIASL